VWLVSLAMVAAVAFSLSNWGGMEAQRRLAREEYLAAEINEDAAVD
jgi:hypothetical protein